MAKQLRDIETVLDEERKPKQAAVNTKKKLETEYKDLESTRDINNKLKEDVLKQLTKLQQAREEIQRDAKEAPPTKNKVLQQSKDLEKKIKGPEANPAPERMLAAKANRKLEKNIKELLLQLEDKRRHADQYKAENEEDEDLWVFDEEKEEEVGEDADD